MTERKKREIAQARRAAEVAAKSADSAPASTSETRFRKNYGIGAWGQRTKRGAGGGGHPRAAGAAAQAPDVDAGMDAPKPVRVSRPSYP